MGRRDLPLGTSVLLTVSLLALYAICAQAQSLPYFAPDVPADETTFVVLPGQPFTGLNNIRVFDDDANGTAQGTIILTQRAFDLGIFYPVKIWRGTFIGAAPGFEPVCDGVSLDPTTAERCRYFCPEVPLPAADASSALARCNAWPVPQVAASGFNFSMSANAQGRLFTNRTVFNLRLNDAGDWSSRVTFANPFRRVCVSVANADNIQTATRRCWNIRYRVPPVLASCMYDRSQARRPCRRDIFPVEPSQNPVVRVAVGQTLITNVYFDLLSTSDTIDIAVLSDPGLPNGANIGPVRGGPGFNGAGVVSDAVINPGSSDLTRFVYSRSITFTPTARDAIKVGSSEESGITYPVCFRAVTMLNGTSPVSSASVCTSIRVVRPEPVGDISVSCPNCDMRLDLPKFTAMVRCPYTWNMVLWERKDFDATYPIDGQLPPSPPALDPRFELAGYRAGWYTPSAVVDPDFPLPQGAQLLPPVQQQVCRNAARRPPFSLDCSSNLYRNVYTQQLQWTPTRGMENSVFMVCFRLSGAVGIDPMVVEPQRICSTVTVSKCRVCTLPGDTLQSIAREYRTDWLQLWGANVLVENPNNLDDYGYITIGPTYTVSKKAESVHIVAGTFGMTIPGLVEVNPDLRGVMSLTEGTDVCIVPPVCKTSQVAA